MTFFGAIETCLRKYATFGGQASRSEFWYFQLFHVVLLFAALAIEEDLSSAVSILLVVPGIAVGCRRLHDIGRTGWWQLLYMVPIFGWIVLIIFFAMRTKQQDDK